MKFSEALMHRIRRSGDRTAQDQIENGTMRDWQARYQQRFSDLCQSMEQVDVLRHAAVSVKHMLMHHVRDALDGHDISVGMQLGEVIILYADITPKGVKCTTVMPSVLLQ